MTVPTISSELKILQIRQQDLRLKLVDCKAAFAAYKEELESLDVKERRLLVKLSAWDFMNDPVKIAAIGRHVMMTMASDADTLCVEDLTAKVDKLLTDDRARVECGLSIEFDENEKRAISQIESLDRDEAHVIAVLHRHHSRLLPAKDLKEGTELTYSQIDSILKRTIDLGLVDRIEKPDTSLGRYRNFYRLSQSVTERIMRWGIRDTKVLPSMFNDRLSGSPMTTALPANLIA